jgi:ubiquinone/menaquinone biosynthesis C-methylase UbiE
MNNYDVETAEYLKHGIRLFQSHLFGNSDLEHAVAFYKLCSPRGVGLDMGCGIGEMGFLLNIVDPSLNIVGVTNSQAQSQHMKTLKRNHIFADYHQVPLESNSVDFIMFNESIGYANINTIFFESARLLKKFGKLFVKDFCNTTSNVDTFYLKSWDYYVYPGNVLVDKACQGELQIDFFIKPKTNFDRFKSFVLASNFKNWHDDSAEGNYDLKMTPMICGFSKL